VGIRKLHEAAAVWQALDALGDQRSFHLIEQFVAGEVFHVDAIVWNRDVVFSLAHQYARPPMDVAHGGGVFCTRRLAEGSAADLELTRLNRRLLETLRFVRGVTHTEFIRSAADGRFYFLETAARVGGAHIVETVEAATGVNLWAEWAKLEIAGEHGAYQVRPTRNRYAGIVLSLAREAHPDTSAFTDPEIWFRVSKDHHIGFVVAADDHARVAALLDDYTRRIAADHLAVAPVPTDRPTS
jgi:hypothetical protein